MIIEFGWNNDYAPPRASRLRHEIAGPAALTNILATRLACQKKIQPPVRRTAAVLAAAQTIYANDPRAYGAEVFAKDPWAMAQSILQWRDELVALGWRGTLGESPRTRLGFLASIEELAKTSEITGQADILAAVDRKLDGLENWPLGIERIVLHDPQDELPAQWQRILRNIEKLQPGTLHASDAGTISPQFDIIRTETVWEAADITARIVSRAEEATLLAGSSTEVLDQELLRRDQPTIGIHESFRQRGISKLLLTFVDAFIGEVDTKKLVDLLNFRAFVTPHTQTQLLTPRVSRALLRALSRQRSTEGTAWNEAIADLAEEAAIARTFTDAYRSKRCDTDAEGLLDASRITAMFDTFLQFMKGKSGISELRRIIDSVHAALAVCPAMTPYMLRQLVAQAAESRPSPLAVVGRSSRITAIKAPGHARGEKLLIWWAPTPGTPSPRGTWTVAEKNQLAAQNIAIPEPSELEKLSINSALRALRSCRKIIAVIPRTLHGANNSVDNPLVTLMSDVITPGVDSKTTFTTNSLLHEEVNPNLAETRRLATGVLTPSAKETFVSTPQTWTIENGESFIPESLSFTSLDKLLTNTPEWLLSSHFHVKPSPSIDIQNDYLLRGFIAHKIFEVMFEESKDPTELDAIFERTWPLFNQDLGQVINTTERQSQRHTVASSYHSLMEILEKSGAHIRRTEAPIEDSTITVPFNGGEKVITLRGSRDLEIETASGVGVIDLKFSKSNKYKEIIEKYGSLQLAIYAYTADPDNYQTIPTGYYLMPSQKLFTMDHIFQGRGVNITDEGQANYTVINKTIRSLGLLFEQMAAGEISNLAVEYAQSSAAESTTKEKEGLVRDFRDQYPLLKDSAIPIEFATYHDYPILTGAGKDFS